MCVLHPGEGLELQHIVECPYRIVHLQRYKPLLCTERNIFLNQKMFEAMKWIAPDHRELVVFPVDGGATILTLRGFEPIVKKGTRCTELVEAIEVHFLAIPHIEEVHSIRCVLASL